MIEKDLVTLFAELSEAETDSERVEIAERIVELDGRHDPAELSHFEVIEVAQQIVNEMIVKIANRKAD
jgi:hypothetical protein